MPGSPRRATAFAVSSRAPTDDPAEITSTSLAGRASRSAVSSAPGSSGMMPPKTGSPPASATSAASAAAVASRTCPGFSSGVSAGTTSSPVEKIVTTGFLCTATDVTPAAASIPRSWGRSGRPVPMISSPGLASSSARTTPSPGATGRTTSIVPGITSAVYSIMTTASAPGGMTPPVGISTALPGVTAASGAAPMRTAPVTVRVAWEALGDAVRVGGADGVAVDGGARESGQRMRRGDRLDRHPAQRHVQRHGLGSGAPVRAEAGQGLGDRPGGEEFPRGRVSHGPRRDGARS